MPARAGSTSTMLACVAVLCASACATPTGPTDPPREVEFQSSEPRRDVGEYLLPPPNRWPLELIHGRPGLRGVRERGVDSGRGDSRDVCSGIVERLPDREERIGYGLGGGLRGFV